MNLSHVTKKGTRHNGRDILRYGSLMYANNGALCWSWSEPELSHGAVVARNDKSRIVGILKYKICLRRFSSLGTHVARGYTRQGIAMALWARALRDLKPTRVTCCIVSDRGRTLIEAVQIANPGFNFNVVEHGRRKTRIL